MLNRNVYFHEDGEHTHVHIHAHTHDGVEHTHEHVHAHVHEGGDHAHTHADGDLTGHEHSHEHSQDCTHECNTCGGCDPMQETLALMQYMVNHNAAHATELAGLAQKLEELGNHAAAEQVLAAVSEFEKGNLRLATVLAALK